MRINKYIAESGFCSRRQADALIEKGRVTINDVVCDLGTRINDGDIICVDNIPIEAKEKHAYIALNKPVGIECTTNIKVKDNIINFVNHPKRIFPIGRLDKDSEGLILLTNDGDIVNKILRAENHHEKEYIVAVNKDITPDFLENMANGVKILGVMTKKCDVYPINNKTFGIILTQGLNRQIRRMCEALGYRVIDLKRIRIMNITLGYLKSGHWRNVTKNELNELKGFLQ
ncbi:MAG: pseudouridine synthase [Clostridiales bacterium]|nr:pseudouridine synthase [Clostridiales bacterium]